MSTVFVGGSRSLWQLTPQICDRLDALLKSGDGVLVGDENGAERAFQSYFAARRYQRVRVVCSGSAPRNNLGAWKVEHSEPPKNAKGFQFYEAKDRAMAGMADSGLMLWDGRSLGTVLNVFRLATRGKPAALVHAATGEVATIDSLDDWRAFYDRCAESMRRDLRDRATPEEWRIAHGLVAGTPAPEPAGDAEAAEPADAAAAAAKAASALNDALARGDAAALSEALEAAARERGLARPDGAVDVATMVQTLESMGLRLEVKPV